MILPNSIAQKSTTLRYGRRVLNAIPERFRDSAWTRESQRINIAMDLLRAEIRRYQVEHQQSPEDSRPPQEDDRTQEEDLYENLDDMPEDELPTVVLEGVESFDWKFECESQEPLPNPSRSSTVSLVPKLSGQRPRENGFVTPRSPGLKRRSSVLDNDIGSVDQKSNLSSITHPPGDSNFNLVPSKSTEMASKMGSTKEKSASYSHQKQEKSRESSSRDFLEDNLTQTGDAVQQSIMPSSISLLDFAFGASEAFGKPTESKKNVSNSASGTESTTSAESTLNGSIFSGGANAISQPQINGSLGSSPSFPPSISNIPSNNSVREVPCTVQSFATTPAATSVCGKVPPDTSNDSNSGSNSQSTPAPPLSSTPSFKFEEPAAAPPFSASAVSASSGQISKETEVKNPTFGNVNNLKFGGMASADTSTENAFDWQKSLESIRSQQSNLREETSEAE